MFWRRKKKTDPAKALRNEVEMLRLELGHTNQRVNDLNRELDAIKESPTRKAYEADVLVLDQLRRCNPGLAN